MNYFIIRGIDVDAEDKRVSVLVGNSEDRPCEYGWQEPLSDGIDFDAWVDMLADKLFGGSAFFHPACEDKAHEAYLKACEALGGDGRYASGKWKTTSPKFKAFRQEWKDKFKEFLFDGQRDERQFVVTAWRHPLSFDAYLDDDANLKFDSHRVADNEPVRHYGYILTRLFLGERPYVKAEAVACDEHDSVA